MKTRRTRFSFLILALALTAQLSLVSPPVQAESASHRTTATATLRGRRCRARCIRQYRLCTRGIVPPRVARCRERLRRCLRRCGR